MTISKRNTVLSILLTFIAVWSLQAQSFNGKIISSQGGEAVPFANVMVKGSNLGVATDFEGKFSITIPNEFKKNTISISAVGFSNKEMPVAELGENKINIISITTQEYNIDEVDVQAESKVLYGAIKKCSKNIAKNYITEPYTCDFTYTNNEAKAKGIISDTKGYQRTTFKGSFRKITYQFTPTEGDNKNTPYFAGKTNMEDLLSFDLVRTVGNVIDEQNVYDFDLKLDTKNTDPNLWVIHFNAKEPKLYNTGDAHATSYEGEIFIKKDNFTITKTVVRGASSKRSSHGKSIAVSEKSSNYTTDLSYDVTTTYKDVDGKFRIDTIEMTESYTTPDGTKESVKSGLSIDKQRTEFSNLKGRDYFVKSL